MILFPSIKWGKKGHLDKMNYLLIKFVIEYYFC